jgi:DNA protecting protein dprA
MLSTETINTMLLSRLALFRQAELLNLYKRAENASQIIDHKDNIKDIIPDASNFLIEALKNIDLFRERVEKELEFIEEKGIRVFTFNDADYPQRLKECPDAPLLLFYKGKASLNPLRCINIIGTRHCTNYGKDLIRSFVKELKSLCPQIVIYSGLAYGVDIYAHRAAIENSIETIGVLAHGLDMIYPSTHKDTAIEMLKTGGLLTEYMSMTQPKPRNFVQRNRIVAGCCDATILVESASKGGGLITCGIAHSYNREIFAFPGNVGSEYSEGCNNLIRKNCANLITSAYDFVQAMGWEDTSKIDIARKKGIERTLFPNVTEEEERIITTLTKHNDLQINMLSIQSGIPFSKLTGLLFSLEMKGIVKMLAGGIYHLYMM